MSKLVDMDIVPEDVIQACNHSYDQIEQGRNPHVTPRLTTDIISIANPSPLTVLQDDDGV